MPVIFLAHGSPLLLDDGGWVRRARRLGGRAAPPEGRADALGALGRPADHARRDAPRAAGLRLLRLPGQVLPDDVPGAAGAGAGGARARPPARPSRSRRIPSAGSTTAPTCRSSPCTRAPTCRCCRRRCRRWTRPTLFALGRALAPLRREGVLIVGSGFLTHNLRTRRFPPDAPTPAWASEFDAWAADVLARRDVDALLDYRARAPGVRQALPTHEHFVPVLVVDGRRHRRHRRHRPLSDHRLRVRHGDAPVRPVRLSA